RRARPVKPQDLRRKPFARLETIGSEIDRPNQLDVPRNGVAVRHSGDEIADFAQLAEPIARALPRLRQQGWIGAVSGGEIRYDPFRFLAHGLELGYIVEPGVEKVLELAFL